MEYNTVGFSKDVVLDWTTNSFSSTRPCCCPSFPYVDRKDRYEGERVAVKCWEITVVPFQKPQTTPCDLRDKGDPCPQNRTCPCSR